MLCKYIAKQPLKRLSLVAYHFGFDHMRREKFIRAGLEVKFEVVERVEDVIPAFDYRLSITQGKVPVEPIRKTL